MLSSTDGVFDVQDDYQLGKEELKLQIKTDKAQEYGLSVAHIAQSIRRSFDGFKATVIRDGDEEIDVVVQYEKDRRQSIQDLQEMNALFALLFATAGTRSSGTTAPALLKSAKSIYQLISSTPSTERQEASLGGLFLDFAR